MAISLDALAAGLCERGNQLVRRRRRRRVLCPCRSKLSGSAGICIIKMLKKPSYRCCKICHFHVSESRIYCYWATANRVCTPALCRESRPQTFSSSKVQMKNSLTRQLRPLFSTSWDLKQNVHTHISAKNVAVKLTWVLRTNLNVVNKYTATFFDLYMTTFYSINVGQSAKLPCLKPLLVILVKFYLPER
jgi:hypothetical protein